MQGASDAELTTITPSGQEAAGFELRILCTEAGQQHGQIQMTSMNQINDLDNIPTVCVMSGDDSLSSTTNMAGVALLRLYLDSRAKSVFNKDIHLKFTHVHGYNTAAIFMFVVYIQFIAALGRFRTGNTDIREQQQFLCTMMKRGADATEPTTFTRSDLQADSIELRFLCNKAEDSHKQNQISDFDSSSTACDMSGDESLSFTTSMEGDVQKIPLHFHHDYGAESYMKNQEHPGCLSID
jgi:hypothetical protein